MVTSNKILTVSYGTFSCTLEGFDDPFTTLQMVAEYFRKLAAEDRYFGGIPRTPDTETLKQIARNATSTDVDADVSESGIVLRQSNAPAPEQDDTVETGADAEMIDKETVAAITTLADPDSAEIDTQTLFRSRRHQTAAVATKAPAPVKPVAPVAAKAAAPVDKNIKQSVEATLAAIRQNVEKAESGSDIAASDEDTSDSFEDDGYEVLEEGVDLLADATEDDADDAQDLTPLILEAADQSDDDAADDSLFDMDVEPAAALGREEAKADPVSKITNDPFFATPIKVKTETAAQAPKQQPKAAEPVSVDKPQQPVQMPALAPVENSILTAAEEAELAADLEAAMLEEDPADTVDTEAATRREQRRLRAESLRNNDDLEREEQALERLLVTTQSKMDKPEQQRRINALDQLKAAVAATEADKKIRLQEVASRDEPEIDEAAADLASYREDLRRAQSQARLSGRTGAAGLRAAPAPLILVSEQRIADPARARDTERAEPRREVAESDGNLALKRDLHIAERSDSDDDRNSGQIRGIPADAFSEATTFADFAERIGAVEMVDLLEAAAAYTSIIEGQSRFSRAQAMSKIAKIVPGDAFTKEAGLRAFGKLLREGKILRVQDGQFAISKASRFSIASRFDE